MIISTPDTGDAEGLVAQMYDDDIREDGFVYAITRAMAVNPAAYEAFEALLTAVTPSIGLRTYELVTLAAARAIGSEHCLLAHGRKSLRAGLFDEDQLAQIITDPADAGLDDAELAAMAYAATLSTAAATMTDADTQRLRDAGYTDRQIVDITLAAAARNFFSRALQALAVPVDDVPGLSPGITAALRARARAVSGG